MKKINIVTYVTKAVFSIAFFIVLFSFVQGHELLDMLDRIEWFYFVLSFLLIPVMLSISCLKWKILLDVKGEHVPFLTLLRIYLIGYFFSNLLPSTVGGDVVRSFYAGKLIDNQAYSAVSVFIERFSGILFLILLVIFAPLLRPQLYSSPYIYVPVVVAIVLLGIISWVWTVKDPLSLPDKMMTIMFTAIKNGADRSGISPVKTAVSFLIRCNDGLFRRLKKFHEELIQAVKIIQNNPALLFKIVVLTIFFYIFTWVNVYVSFRAFGVNPDFLTLCALIPTIMFVAHLPVTLLGNLGFFESVFVLYFMLIPILPAESLAMGLLLRVKMLFLGILGYLVYLSYKYYRNLELEQLEQFVEKKQQETSV